MTVFPPEPHGAPGFFILEPKMVHFEVYNRISTVVDELSKRNDLELQRLQETAKYLWPKPPYGYSAMKWPKGVRRI